MNDMQTNECKIISNKQSYMFEICRTNEGFIIMSFNYGQYGLNLSTDKIYKTAGQCIAAGKNIFNVHFKRKGYNIKF